MPDDNIETAPEKSALEAEWDAMVAEHGEDAPSGDVDPFQEQVAKKAFVPPQVDFPAPVSALQAGARGLINGATMGWADEAASGLTSLFGGEGSRALAMERAKNKQAQRQHPGSFMSGNMAGNVATTAALPGGAIGRMALSGATSSLGDSEDKTSLGALAAAGGSAAAGAATGTIAKGLSQLVRYESAPKFSKIAGEAFDEIDFGNKSGQLVASPITNKLAWGARNTNLPVVGQALSTPAYHAIKGGLSTVGVAGHAASSPLGSGTMSGAGNTMRDMAIAKARQIVDSAQPGTPQGAAHQQQMEVNPEYRKAYIEDKK